MWLHLRRARFRRRGVERSWLRNSGLLAGLTGGWLRGDDRSPPAPFRLGRIRPGPLEFGFKREPLALPFLGFFRRVAQPCRVVVADHGERDTLHDHQAVFRLGMADDGE